MKKIISCLLAITILLTLFVIPIATRAAVTTVDTFHPSYKAGTYSNAWTGIAYNGTITKTNAPTDRYYSKGQDTNSTVKCEYGGAKISDSIADSDRVARLYINEYITNNTGYTNVDTSYLTFWVYSDQACRVKVRFQDRTIDTSTSTAPYSNYAFIDLVAGEQIVEIPFSDFKKSSNNFGWEKLYQLIFIIYGCAESTSTSGVIYIDEIGFIDKADDNAQLAFHDSYIASEYKGTAGWVNRDSDYSSTSFTGKSKITKDSTVKYFSGGADTTAVIGCDYTGMTSETTATCRFFFNGHIQNNLPVVNVNATFLTFWAYSTQACKLKISFTDVDGTNKWSGRAVNTATVNLSGGAQIVKIPLTTFAKDTVDGYLWQYLCQPQFNVYKSGDSAFTAGSVYIDEIGFIDCTTAGDVNGDFEVNLKDLICLYKLKINGADAEGVTNIDPFDTFKDGLINLRDVSVLRKYFLGLGAASVIPYSRDDDTFGVITTNWDSGLLANGNNIAPFEVESDSLYYYAEQNDSTALKVTYSGITESDAADKKDARVVYRSTVTPAYSDQGVVSAYIYADQPLKVQILWQWNVTGTVMSTSKTVDLVAGDNIVALPLSEQISSDNADSVPADYSFKDLQFRFYKYDSSSADSGVIYIDSLGICDLNPGRNSSFKEYERTYFNSPNGYVFKATGNATLYRSADIGMSYERYSSDRKGFVLPYDKVDAGSVTAARISTGTAAVAPQYGANTIITLAAYVEEEMTFSTLWYWGNGTSNGTARYEQDLQPGWNLISIPMADYATANTPADYSFNTWILDFKNMTSNTGTIYIDSIGYCDSSFFQ